MRKLQGSLFKDAFRITHEVHKISFYLVLFFDEDKLCIMRLMHNLERTQKNYVCI